MATAESTKQISPEELLAMPDGDKYELVDGELVERQMGWNSSSVGLRVGQFLMNYRDANPIGRAAGADAGYQCFPDDPLKVRKPDASFIRNERLPTEEDLEGWCRIAPNVAAEVVSPNDFYSDIEVKVAEYLAVGVDLVWVINPPTRSVRVHRADGTLTDLDDKDFLDGENVLPGFHCAVADLFK